MYRLDKTSNCVFSLCYHLIIVVKYRKYCPNKDLDVENGNYANHPVCHWCRVTFDNAVMEVKDYIRNKLE